jgi:glycosyltransferase involved in cell wall biosynthesis
VESGAVLSMLTQVSVIIPCYNYGRFLGRAIESALSQSQSEVEVIVVDDGSTDDTPAVAARYPSVRYFRQRNLGESEARNRGTAEARGEFILFLDADDELTPEAISTSIQCLRERPDCLFSYGHQELIDADGSVITSKPERAAIFRTCIREKDAYAYMLRKNNPIRAPGAILYRTEAVRRTGGFAPEFRTAADLDFNLRIARGQTICCNDRIVLLTRLHDANTTLNSRMMLQGAVRVQRRQRGFASRHPIYKRDYQKGLRLARSYWGTHLVQQILSDVRARKIRAAACGFWTLTRFAPGAGAVAAARLLLKNIRKTASR